MTRWTMDVVSSTIASNYFPMMEETEEVNGMKTVTMDAMPSAIILRNLPKVEQISSPSSSPAPEDRSCCQSSGIQIMNTFSEDLLNSKAHKDVATTHKAPRHRNSVVETGVEEFDMVDVSSGRTVVSDYVPTVKQLPEITDSNENPISCLHHGGGT